MSGLIDSGDGLSFGGSLEFMDVIGGPNLDIEVGGVTPEMELLWGTDFLVWDTLNLTWGLE